jgi:ABC-type sulfate/molybdate transport systems ATPase subunit
VSICPLRHSLTARRFLLSCGCAPSPIAVEISLAILLVAGPYNGINWYVAAYPTSRGGSWNCGSVGAGKIGEPEMRHAAAMLDAHIVKTRSSFTVEVELKVRRGESVGLFGASGAGKSTVLSCLAGFEEPDRGHVTLGALRLFPPSLPLYQRPVGYQSQADSLFPHLSVAQNVCFGLANHRNGSLAWVKELKGRLRLANVWNEFPGTISGGQARRVALARMLARQPQLVLLDEPFTALDRATVDDLLKTLLEWQSALNFTLIAVDHRADILARLCSRVIVIESGRVIQADSWKRVHAAPANSRIAHLLGSPNDLEPLT